MEASHRPRSPSGPPVDPRFDDARGIAPGRRQEVALLLPGWGTDPARMRPLAAALQADGIEGHTLPYRTTGTLDEAAAPVIDTIRRTRAERIHLVGHSLGGVLVAVASLHEPDRIATVTTINTPWRGTWVAWTGQGRLATALKWGSPELTELRDRLADHTRDPEGPAWLLLAVLGDLATPATTALRSGSRGPRISRRVIRSTGHSNSLASVRLHAAVTSHVNGPGRFHAAS